MHYWDKLRATGHRIMVKSQPCAHGLRGQSPWAKAHRVDHEERCDPFRLDHGIVVSLNRDTRYLKAYVYGEPDEWYREYARYFGLGLAIGTPEESEYGAGTHPVTFGPHPVPPRWRAS